MNCAYFPVEAIISLSLDELQRQVSLTSGEHINSVLCMHVSLLHVSSLPQIFHILKDHVRTTDSASSGYFLTFCKFN